MIVYRPISSIQAMTFDLDDTLYDNHPAIIRAESLLKEKMTKAFPKAAALSRSQLNIIKKQYIQKDKRLAWDMGKLRMCVLKHILTQEAGESREEAAQSLLDYFYFARSEVPISDHVHHFLATLSKRIPLVGITNGNINTEQAGISTYFKAVLHASVDRPAKPHSAMFNEASDIINLPPKHILHIGDSLVNDVLGAYQAGYKSAWYAYNRPMNLATESVVTLPDIQLGTLEDLYAFIPVH